MALKISIFSYVFYPESFLINELVDSFSKKGHSVIVSTGLPNYPTGKFHAGFSLFGPYKDKYQLAKIFRFPVLPRKQGFLWLTLNYITNLFFGCLNLLRLPKTDIAFVFSTSPIFSAIPAILQKKIRGTPVVLWLQDLWPESFGAIAKISESSFIYKLVEALVVWIYKNADLVLIQSEAFKGNLEKYNYRGPIEYIPNWAPEIAANNEPAGWQKEIPKKKHIITFTGNIGKAQSLQTLLTAAKDFNDRTDLLFLIVGDGSDKKRLEKFVADNAIQNILFVGRKPQTDMPYVYSLSSCLYVSLTNDPVFNLVLPSKVQAYMAAGKPILASLDGEGARIIQEAKAGFVARSESVSSLKEQIEKILSLEESDLQEIGNNSYQYYLDHFEKNKIINQIEQLLKEKKI